MQNSRKQLFFSIIDQGAVSAGNFLTIALGAKFLLVADQGKLIYLYAIYIGLVLFNLAAFYSSANIVNQEFKLSRCYERLIFFAQMILAVLLVVLLAFWLSAEYLHVEWAPQPREIGAACLFIFCQQMADFYRRTGYVFERVINVTTSSVWLYSGRIIGLYLIKPNNLTDFLLIMTLPTLPVLLVIVVSQLRYRTFVCGQENMKAMFFRHAFLSQWNIANAPLKWVGIHLPILLVATLHSLEAAAVLGSIRAITNLANILLELFETFLPAWLTSKFASGHESMLKSSLDLVRLGAVSWLIGVVGFWLVGNSVVSYLLGEHYVQYSSILYITWLASGLAFGGRVVGLYYRIKQHIMLEFVGSAVGTIAMLLSINLIKQYGPWGGAWTMVVFQFFVLIGMLLYRYFKIYRKYDA